MSTPLLFFSSVAIWGTTWLAITYQLAGAAPEAGVAWRFVCAAGLLFAWCLARGVPLRFGRGMHALFAVQGIAGFSISYLFVYHAERFIVSGLVAVGYAASPLVNMLMARWLLRMPMIRQVGLGGLLGLSGIVLIFGHEFARLDFNGPVAVGAALTVAAVLLSSVATLAAARYQQHGVKGWAPLAWAMAYGSATTLVAALAFSRPLTVRPSPAFVVSFAYLVIAGSVLAFGAYYALLARIGPARTGYVGVMVPIVALLVSALFEGYPLTWQSLAGATLAVAGNVLALQRPRGGAARA